MASPAHPIQAVPPLSETPDPAVKRGFTNLRCPLCAADGTITVSLLDLADFHCHECDEDFTGEDVEAFFATWRPVLDWIRFAPKLPE